MKFSTDFFNKNRKALIKSCKAELVVIAANTTLQRNADTSYAFRQDSNFWYLSGINEPDYTLVISDKETYLISPKLTHYQLIMESQTSRESLREASGIQKILDSEEGWSKLQKQLKQVKKVGILKQPNTKYYAIAPNPARLSLLKRLKKYTQTEKIIDIKDSLARLRMVKQPQEIAAIQKAIDVTAETISEVFKSGWYNKVQYEYEVEAALGYGFRKHGAAGHAFTPIVISGSKTSSIHNFNSEDKLNLGQILQVDIGAEVSNYAADISRVLPIGQNFSKRQAEIVDAVAEVQKFALSLVKPGALLKDNEKAVEEYMGRVLKRLGLITSSSQSAIRARYPHSCSHMLGLDVHDIADYSMPLSENMVLTVEPGIYIPEEGIGVRIEDDVLVTKSGHEVLSHKLPTLLA